MKDVTRGITGTACSIISLCSADELITVLTLLVGIVCAADTVIKEVGKLIAYFKNKKGG